MKIDFVTNPFGRLDANRRVAVAAHDEPPRTQCEPVQLSRDYSQCESMAEARRIEPGFYLRPLGLWAEASFLNMKFS
jgi:hypothetical protein